MKLFQKLLLAPAALGLLAPVAANAADVNIAGLSQYGTEEQVTSITQFSDVQPTDWAYQALSNLIERYGCVAGYPNGTYRGNRAIKQRLIPPEGREPLAALLDPAGLEGVVPLVMGQVAAGRNAEQ